MKFFCSRIRILRPHVFVKEAFYENFTSLPLPTSIFSVPMVEKWSIHLRSCNRNKGQLTDLLLILLHSLSNLDIMPHSSCKGGKINLNSFLINDLESCCGFCFWSKFVKFKAFIEIISILSLKCCNSGCKHKRFQAIRMLILNIIEIVVFILCK